MIYMDYNRCTEGYSSIRWLYVSKWWKLWFSKLKKTIFITLFCKVLWIELKLVHTLQANTWHIPIDCLLDTSVFCSLTCELWTYGFIVSVFSVLFNQETDSVWGFEEAWYPTSTWGKIHVTLSGVVIFTFWLLTFSFLEQVSHNLTCNNICSILNISRY